MRCSRTFWLMVIAVLLSSAQMVALDPTVLLSQLGHTAWRTREGFFSGAVTAISQTSDGYLLIGTTRGLLRSDGISFVPQEQSLQIKALKRSSDGTIWIGTSCCLFRYVQGRLSPMPDFNGWINEITEDQNGTIWFTRSRSTPSNPGVLCRIHETSFKCLGREDGVDLSGAGGLAVDDNRGLWVASTLDMLRWTPQGTERFAHQKSKFTGSPDGIQSILPQAGGTVLVGFSPSGVGMGLQELTGSSWVDPKLGNRYGHTISVTTLFRDRNSVLWIGTADEGILRYANGTLEKFSESQGLSGNTVNTVFEDDEGNIWIGTSKGLDRFRDLRVLTFTTSEGLTSDSVLSVTAAGLGGVWVGNHGSLSRIQHNRVVNIDRRQGLPGERVTSLLQDREERLWVGIDNELFVYQNGEFRQVLTENGEASGAVAGLAQTSDDQIWVLTVGHPTKLYSTTRLYSISPQQMVLRNTDPQIPPPLSLAPDTDGGIFLTLDPAYSSASIARYNHGAMGLVTVPDHPRLFNPIFQGDYVWATSSKGLLILHGRTVRLLNHDQGLPCTAAYSLALDKMGNLWIYMECGLVMLTPFQQQQLVAGDRLSSPRLFNALDGFESGASFTYAPDHAVSSDGKVWFANGTDLQSIDPGRFGWNATSLPVKIESLIVDHRDVGLSEDLRIGPIVRGIEIGYTALSLSVPEKTHFRYKLEGHDSNWQNVGTRRRAFYNDLRPGSYRFHLMATNDDGLWSAEEATISFIVLPAWYQTKLFNSLSLFLAFGTLVGFYRLRVRYIQREARARYDERLAERTRIAQDIHDTLLQTIEGSKWVADADTQDPFELAS
jgi:ligand-binding sensor domain-containing protein